MTLGEKLRELRTDKGYSLARAAQLLGPKTPGGERPLSRMAISNWELDKAPPSRDHLFKLADLYQVDINVLRALMEGRPEPPRAGAVSPKSSCSYDDNSIAVSSEDHSAERRLTDEQNQPRTSRP